MGITRYEYNFPPNVVIDDKTRQMTQNVTRVYWENSGKAADKVDVAPHAILSKSFVQLKNKHQGMFLATQFLLRAWRDREGCNFDVVRKRPGLKNHPSQPSEGTQRVWMSTNMLYGAKHCNVQQVLPADHFGALNVLHLPNKNYRRVGKKGRIGGAKVAAAESEGEAERAVQPDASLLAAMDLHLEMRKRVPGEVQQPYHGIVMVDEIDSKRKDAHRKMVDRVLEQYQEYVRRGGVMVQSDMVADFLSAVAYT